jgi:hypothetical protein
VEFRKIWPWGAAAAIGALIFWPRNASAANAPAGTKATVNPNAEGGMKVRNAPNLTAAQVGSAPSGSTVSVLQTGVKPTDGSGGEWWQIADAAGVTGFSRAVDPQGVHNFTLIAGAPV